MFNSFPAILLWLFDILWTQAVNGKGKQNSVAFYAHFVFYFVAISVRLSKFRRDFDNQLGAAFARIDNCRATTT